ncbi:MAG: DHH family phosphoesterase [Candidatus Pacebacteria bacterium]|nr:DHH family phosphoesterase [Candidatus Paceibacterota bacterium]
MPTYKLRPFQGDSFLDHLLHSRGVTDPTEKTAFLSPNYDLGTHDPFLLKDMKKVVERILRAVSTDEKICIYSDFDADGIPGAVVLHDFFKKISYVNTFHYIPDRHIEGFGIHRPALEKIIAQGATLIISIDCGIAEIDNAAWVKTQKAQEIFGENSTKTQEGDSTKAVDSIDLIITDHHTPGAILPDAFAIINPKQIDCEYPEKMLCGSGVIYKVVQALCQTIREKDFSNFNDDAVSNAIAAYFKDIEIKEGWEKWLLDMVGLATLSDMVPLRGENRIFAYFGLTVLRKTPRLGLIKLFKSLKMNPAHMTEEDIAFMITPRINAASRMASPMDAFHLLATTDDAEADRLVEHLNNLNTERKTRVAHLVKAIKKSIEERDLQHKPIIVVGNPDWQPPVLGLVATNIVRDYGKPVFLWGRDEEGVIKGSCRAPDGHDVVKIMRAIPEADGVFLNMGGHVAAGGYSVSSEKIHVFEEKILEAHAGILKAVEDAKVAIDVANKAAGIKGINGTDGEHGVGVAVLGEILVDKVLNAGEVGRTVWNVIEKVGPYGESNPKPLFMMKGITVMDIKYFGKTKEHLELRLQDGLSGDETKAIKFFAKEDKALEGKLKIGELADLIVHMEKSMFKNYPEYRLRIVDIL